ncbi:hypothetical protein QRX60_15395 [Amycolatopsis mongoliensis]|uniref:Uncharacterized protein n=1 Tax=Amycolatopsis mongoliensis TaxID=715475 RepID=A0A9Y2JX84_9PSEU|nr:hypothetical protein [Amycolatopsis sp. 4-36]WIY05152.1 hypothetical protein QRX60_15395 [Amycolatopsis sp. 4-36]
MIRFLPRSTRWRVALFAALASALVLGLGSYWFVRSLTTGLENSARALASDRVSAVLALLNSGVARLTFPPARQHVRIHDQRRGGEPVLDRPRTAADRGQRRGLRAGLRDRPAVRPRSSSAASPGSPCGGRCAVGGIRAEVARPHAVDLGDEITELAVTRNEMLARLDRSTVGSGTAAVTGQSGGVPAGYRRTEIEGDPRPE